MLCCGTKILAGYDRTQEAPNPMADPRVYLILLATCVACVGCSNQPEVAPVRGVVMMDGKPLPGGRIMFEPIASGDNKVIGKSAFGEIESDGTFVLMTYEEGDGALVGSHHPVVMGDRQEEDPELNPKGIRTGPNIGVIRMPETTFEVVAGQENEFTIELKSRSYDVMDQVEND